MQATRPGCRRNHRPPPLRRRPRRSGRRYRPGPTVPWCLEVPGVPVRPAGRGPRYRPWGQEDQSPRPDRPDLAGLRDPEAPARQPAPCDRSGPGRTLGAGLAAHTGDALWALRSSCAYGTLRARRALKALGSFGSPWACGSIRARRTGGTCRSFRTSLTGRARSACQRGRRAFRPRSRCSHPHGDVIGLAPSAPGGPCSPEPPPAPKGR